MQRKERRGERKRENEKGKGKEKGEENKMGKGMELHLEKEEEMKECKPTVCSSFSLIYTAPKVACPALFDRPDKYCVCLSVELW